MTRYTINLCCYYYVVNECLGVGLGVEDSLSVIPHLWDWVTEAECKRSANVNAQTAAVKKKEKRTTYF